MARKVSPVDSLPVRSNPDVLGEDLVALAEEVFSAGVVGFGNAAVVRPVVANMVPQAAAGGSMGKLVNIGTTVLTGWGVYQVARAVVPSIANRVREGAAFAVGLTALASFLPGFSGTVSFAVPGVSRLTQIADQKGAKDTKALPAGAPGDLVQSAPGKAVSPSLYAAI